MPPRQGKHRKPERPIGDLSIDDGFGVWAARFCEWMQVRNYSSQTIRNRTSYLRLFVEWCSERGLTKPMEITKPILERYQRHLFYYRRPNGTPLSFRAQNARLLALKAFFKWAGRSNVVPANPASELDLPRLPHRLPPAVLSHAEVELVMGQPDMGTSVGIRDRAIMEVLYSTGMRRLEVVRLRVFDIDQERRTVHIHEGKGQRDRIVPIGERALGWVRRYLDEVRPRFASGSDDGVLFLSTLGESLHPDWLTQVTRAYVKNADLGKQGACHIFRHSMATAMLERGADIRFIQEMLGHAHLDSTQIYTRVSIRALQAVHEATHPAGRKDGKTTKDKPTQNPPVAELLAALADEADADQEPENDHES